MDRRSKKFITLICTLHADKAKLKNITMASLGNDLVVLRKDQDLSFKDIQQITKLSPRVIESIEDGSIFEKINEETTYIRNYVRNYAKAVGIEEKKIVTALNQLEKGEYTGGLLDEDTDKPEDETDQTDKKSDETKTEAEKKSSQQPPAEPAANANMATPDHPTRRSSTINWEELSQKTAPKNKSTFSSWIIILIVIVLAVGTALIYNYFTGESQNSHAPNTQTEASEPAVPSDTLQQALLPEQQSSSIGLANKPLPDTLTLAVVAASGKLAPIHIYTDINQNRPYWVEKHDTLRVNFTDTMQIWGIDQFKQIELIFNERYISNAHNKLYNTKTERYTITRKTIKKITGRDLSSNQP